MSRFRSNKRIASCKTIASKGRSRSDYESRVNSSATSSDVSTCAVRPRCRRGWELQRRCANLECAARIATTHESIGGRKAIGRIGDYLLQNDKIRVIVQDKGPGRGNALYGGTLIDADLVRPGGADGHGNDQLGEVLSGIFIFDHRTDRRHGYVPGGSDGGPAKITVSGPGADFLAPLRWSTYLLYPPSLTFTEEFTRARQAVRRDQKHGEEQFGGCAAAAVDQSVAIPKPARHGDSWRVESAAVSADGPLAVARRRASAVRCLA